MKTLILSLAAVAFASNASAFVCSYEGTNNSSIYVLKIEAQNNGDQLNNVKAYANVQDPYDYNNDRANGVGDLTHVAYKKAGSKYAANYYRFDLSQLKDAKAGDIYLPGDSCELELHIPKQISSSSFQAPLVIHCDQSGGTITVTCEQ